MDDRWWEDDEELLSIVVDAIREERAVPAGVVDAGMATAIWGAADDELAMLTHDSLTAAGAGGTRAEQAGIRAVTFTGRTTTIHLQLSGTGLHGQIVPARRGVLEVQTGSGPGQRVDIDEHGWFSISPVPAQPFRLLIHVAPGGGILTGWLQT